VTVQRSPGPHVRVAGITVAALTIGFLFITSILGAYHAPTPHHVQIGIVGPAQVAAPVKAALGQRAPGAFDLVSYQDTEAATRAVETRDVYAAFVLPTPGAAQAGAQLIIASGIGASPAQVIRTVFTEAAAAMQTPVNVRDIAPLPSGDPLGVSPYFFCVALYMPSFLFGIMLTFAAARASAASKIVSVIVFAVLLGIVEIAVADGLTGALTGHATALAGLGMLTALAFAATVAALGRMFGSAGVGLSTLAFLIAGIPSSGGPFGVSFLPEFYRVVGPGLPLTNAASAARNISYFNSHAVAAPLSVLGVWAGGGLLLLAVVAFLENNPRAPRWLRKVPAEAPTRPVPPADTATASPSPAPSPSSGAASAAH
jgi:hypothetical protein